MFPKLYEQGLTAPVSSSEMNFKQLRRSDELEKVDVFKQSDSWALRLMVLSAPQALPTLEPREKNTPPNVLADKRKGQEVLLLSCPL